MKRLNTIIGMADWPTSEWPQQEKDLYGLGKVRDTEKFFKTFGIHLKEQRVEHHLCRFVGKPMMKVRERCAVSAMFRGSPCGLTGYLFFSGILARPPNKPNGH